MQLAQKDKNSGDEELLYKFMALQPQDRGIIQREINRLNLGSPDLHPNDQSETEYIFDLHR